ncbi:MAG TPA: hypothetical protein VKE96_12435 [Vicinamibacterales bacterium]|nr:hypothetical protein [Vicinamibacterales bacterium]
MTSTNPLLPRVLLETPHGVYELIGTGAAIALAVGAGATAGGTIYAAKSQANAAKEAAATGAASAERSTQLQTDAQKAALDYEKQKDAEAARQADRVQRANYAQWAAKEARMNDIRRELGMNVRDIPSYEDALGPDTAAVPTTTVPGVAGGSITVGPGGVTQTPPRGIPTGPITTAPPTAATPPNTILANLVQQGNQPAQPINVAPVTVARPTYLNPGGNLYLPNTIGRFVAQ